eukprot:XP_001701407.1 predicted protein [Chlamydomonas reinhardtii]
MEEVVRSLHGAAAARSGDPALQWGHQHEPNCLWTVLNSLKLIPGFKDATTWFIREQSFLPCGGLGGLPPMGASPDGILEVEVPGEIPGQERLAWLLLEFKSRFPYNKPYGVECSRVQLGMFASHTVLYLYLESSPTLRGFV